METEQLLHLVCKTFYYDDGVLKYKGGPYQPKDKIPGWVQPDTGYHMVKLDGKHYRSHRLIFLMYHRRLPELIDHIDRNKLNNRIENLREATKSLNALNSERSEKGGVSFRSDRNKWRAYTRKGDKQKFLGNFDTKVEALNRVAEERKYGNNS